MHAHDRKIIQARQENILSAVFHRLPGPLERGNHCPISSVSFLEVSICACMRACVCAYVCVGVHMDVCIPLNFNRNFFTYLLCILLYLLTNISWKLFYIST